MQNANRTWCARRRVLAFCVLQVAVLGCARPARVAVPAPVEALQQLEQQLFAATRSSGVRRAGWGVIVHSLDRNERLFELNPRTLFVPASVAKLVSAATAADAVGWDYRFQTTLRATGPIADGVLSGDLVIVGSGDPTIAGRAGDDVSVFVDAVKAAGIRRIAGRIIGDDDAVEEPRPQLAWAWDDLGYTTGALFGALNLEENRMAVTVTAGPTAGAAAALNVEPHAAYRPLANRIVTGPPGSTQALWPEQRPGETHLTLTGTIPAGAPPARLNVSVGNPTFWFASVLRARLQQQGIEVTGEAWDIDDVSPAVDRAAGAVVFTYRSRPLADIIQPMLKDSINLYAEAVMRLNAAGGTFPATNDAALEGVRRRLESWGVTADSQQVIDGSGLSRRDAIAPEALLLVLQRMHDATLQSPFMRGLPVAGVDGSLAARMRDTAAAGNVRAKTGTMSNIRSLAGYVTTRDGERLAFVAIINNFEGTGADANQALDSIAIRLAAFTRSR